MDDITSQDGGEAYLFKLSPFVLVYQYRNHLFWIRIFNWNRFRRPTSGKARAAAPILDRIQLVDGQSMDGTYVGGTKSTLQFEVDGDIKEIPVDQITSIVFAPPAP